MQFQGLGVRAVPVSPDDDSLIGTTIGLYVGSEGDIVVNMQADLDTDVIFPDVPAGNWMPISVSRVKATGTTASGIVALYS